MEAIVWSSARLATVASLATLILGGCGGSSKISSTLSRTWELGHCLSLSALAHGQGARPTIYAAKLKSAQDAARELRLAPPELPDRSGNSVDDSARMLGYLLNERGPALASELSDHYGEQHAALFQFAVRCNVLYLIYDPEVQTCQELAKELDSLAKAAEIDKTIYRDVVLYIQSRRSRDAVLQAIDIAQQKLRSKFGLVSG